MWGMWGVGVPVACYVWPTELWVCEGCQCQSSHVWQLWGHQQLSSVPLLSLHTFKIEPVYTHQEGYIRFPGKMKSRLPYVCD